MDTNNCELDKIARALEEQNRQLKYRNWFDTMEELNGMGVLNYEQYVEWKEKLLKYAGLR